MVLAKKISALILSLTISTSLYALSVPPLRAHVNDNANVIISTDEQQLENYLTNLEETTGIQIAVLTIPGLEGEDLAVYALKVCESWKLGQKDKDNGALLLVSMSERQVRIETGYGLEDKLTDAKCGLIIRNVIIPEFKNGNYSKGIVKGIQNMGGIASNNAELVNKSVQQNADMNSSIVELFGIIIWILFVFLIISSKTGLWRYIFFREAMRRPRYRNNYRTFHFGPTNFGGFSSGTHFSGGGGHFGGGGASGHW